MKYCKNSHSLGLQSVFKLISLFTNIRECKQNRHFLNRNLSMRMSAHLDLKIMTDLQCVTEMTSSLRVYFRSAPCLFMDEHRQKPWNKRSSRRHEEFHSDSSHVTFPSLTVCHQWARANAVAIVIPCMFAILHRAFFFSSFFSWKRMAAFSSFKMLYFK